MFRLNLKLADRLLERRRGVAKASAALAGIAILVAGAGDWGDRLLRLSRDQIRAHPASGEIHIVEIDARSLRAIDRWPWPRRHHGEAVDRLAASGARTIAFDIDFSAVSTPADDSAFAAALRRAGGGVILPTLRQREAAASSDFIDNLPIEPLRENAFLASVNIAPDSDGYVRQMPLGTETAGVPRPSLAALLAERPAEIGRGFPIDYAIDPDSIPRHSFIDLVEGRIPAETLSGKRVLIGATAVEIWDRYAVPGHGVIPGVVIQALAAETLLAGPVPSRASGLWGLLLALVVVAGTLRSGNRALRAAAFAAGAAALLALPIAAEQWLAVSFPLAPALAVLATAAMVALGFHGAYRYRERLLTDGETGLPNLAALEAAAAAADAPVVVARIERFAAIAAGLGPEAAARLIRRVSERLGFGRSQPVYRIDDSCLAWLEPDEEGPIEERLEALTSLMRSPVDCGRLVDVTLAFGIADPAGGRAKQQVANAALAAERAARCGSRWQRFDPHGSDETDWHLSLLGELDSAMADGRLWNAYQPKLDIADGRIRAVEALVRWDHPERGQIGPDAFIPLVETQGRARDLTLFVFERALADAGRWRSLGHDMAVAVNVSATLLLDDGFTALLHERLARSSVPAERVTIEVTESAAVADPERAVATLESWRALGLEISIDDYGTGQSSLGHLQKLPATELKIDMSFVTNMAADARNAIMVRSTIAMAHELGMAVVAEGVEDGECLRLLGEMGCDTAQGWFVGRPVPARDIEHLLQGRARAAA